MGYGGIVTGVVFATVALMPAEFSTRDVSEHRLMLDAHPEPRHSHYHAFVGKELKALSDGRGALVLEEIRKRTPRGSVWRKREGAVVGRAVPRDRKKDVAAVRRGSPQVEPVSATPVKEQRLDLGPQHAGDGAFAKVMRRHQSWYRTVVLKAPYGTGPKVYSKSFYGNMLTVEDGRRGLNFLTPSIFESAKRRVAQGTGMVEEFRLYCNMLSSQPMCFNLLGPQITDLDLATTLWKAVLPSEIERVTRVEIEWSPEPRFEYLDDRTAFDAFVEYERPDGTSAFIGIETKLTEHFSAEHYDNPAYRRWMECGDAPWRTDAWNRVDAVMHNQLWRDHLLAVALRKHRDSKYGHGRLMLVRHPGDVECARIVDGYRSLLKPGDDTFIDMPLDRIVDGWSKVIGAEHRAWLDAFRLRYLDLHRSV